LVKRRENKRFVRNLTTRFFKRVSDSLFHRHGATFCHERFKPGIPKLITRHLDMTIELGAILWIVAKRVGEPNHALVFNADGTFAVMEGSGTLVRGTYSVDGDTYTELSNDAGCTDVPKSFKYTFNGTNLTFNYIDNPADDYCGGRRFDFDNVTYTLSK